MMNINSIEIIPAANGNNREGSFGADSQDARAHRLRPEDMFGLLSDVIDDEFLEIVLGHRRRARATEISL